MGHKHVNTLKDFTSALPQERVGEGANVTSEKCGREADVRSTHERSTDALVSEQNLVSKEEQEKREQEPAPVETYAQVVKKQSRVESVRSRIVSFDAPLTLKK